MAFANTGRIRPSVVFIGGLDRSKSFFHAELAKSTCAISSRTTSGPTAARWSSIPLPFAMSPYGQNTRAMWRLADPYGACVGGYHELSVMRDRFHWARLLAFVTGLVNHELLLRNEYLVAENRILRAHLPRKVKKHKLLEFNGGCRMSGQFAKVGLNGT